MLHLKKPIFECCTDSYESALVAREAGADRLELCANLVIGGTTPSISLFELVKENGCPPANILIRPRFGDFCYTDNEFEQIRRDVARFRDAGANGVVIGILQTDGNLDCKRMEILIKEAGSLEITLHRAFDLCVDPFKTMRECHELGIDTILTSGQQNSCYEGRDLIKKLVAYSKEHLDNSIDILVAGGVNAERILELAPYTEATSFHASGKKTLDSPMKFRREGVNMGLPSMSEYDIWRTDLETLREAVEALHKAVK